MTGCGWFLFLITVGSALPDGMLEAGVARRAAGSTVRLGAFSRWVAVFSLVRLGWPW